MSMNCGCGGCISRSVICVPRGNSKRLVFRVNDSNGDPFDISAADEITFAVYSGTVTSGNIGPGGSLVYEKTLTDGDIVIGGDGASFYVDIAPVDSVLPTKVLNYYEANVTTSSGDVYTVSAGVYQADNLRRCYHYFAPRTGVFFHGERHRHGNSTSWSDYRIYDRSRWTGP